jgi:hypothetical protein
MGAGTLGGRRSPPRRATDSVLGSWLWESGPESRGLWRGVVRRQEGGSRARECLRDARRANPQNPVLGVAGPWQPPAQARGWSGGRKGARRGPPRSPAHGSRGSRRRGSPPRRETRASSECGLGVPGPRSRGSGREWSRGRKGARGPRESRPWSRGLGGAGVPPRRETGAVLGIWRGESCRRKPGAQAGSGFRGRRGVEGPPGVPPMGAGALGARGLRDARRGAVLGVWFWELPAHGSRRPRRGVGPGAGRAPEGASAKSRPW